MLIEFIDVSGIILQCIVSMAIIDRISNIQVCYKTWIMKVVCLSLRVIIFLIVMKMGSRWNIANILFDVIGYCLYLMILKRQKFQMMFAVIMEVQIINTVCALCAAAIISGISSMLDKTTYYLVLSALVYLLRLLPLGFLYLLCKKYQINRILDNRRMQMVIIAIGLLFQFTRLTIYIFTANTNELFLYIALTVLIMGIIFGSLWVVDWYLNECEKKILWEDNDRMSQRLHRSKEIMPALNVALEQLKKYETYTEFNKILEEVHQLCREQMGEDEIEDMAYKSFPTTGIHVLDEQIQLYEKEAVKKGINFDLFVGISLAEVIKEKDIKELDFLRLIGDLMRNALRAIEKSQKQKGNILLVMGSVEHTFQIDIYDDGIPFPLFILNEFGKRGNTQGGSGHGISDMLEFLESQQATFRLTEYEEGSVFSKGISIIWNQENKRLIDSYRSSQISEDSILSSEEL